MFGKWWHSSYTYPIFLRQRSDIRCIRSIRFVISWTVFGWALSHSYSASFTSLRFFSMQFGRMLWLADLLFQLNTCYSWWAPRIRSAFVRAPFESLHIFVNFALTYTVIVALRCQYAVSYTNFHTLCSQKSDQIVVLL